MTIENHFKTTCWTPEHSTGKPVRVSGVIKVTSTSTAQVMLAGKDYYRLGKHIKTDWTTKLFFQTLHRTSWPHQGAGPLDFHFSYRGCLILATVSVVILGHKHVPLAVSSTDAQQPRVLYRPLAACDTQAQQPIRAHGLFSSLFLEKQHPHLPSASMCHVAPRVQDTTLSITNSLWFNTSEGINKPRQSSHGHTVKWLFL